jgi:hypothetical protein
MPNGFHRPVETIIGNKIQDVLGNEAFLRLQFQTMPLWSRVFWNSAAALDLYRRPARELGDVSSGYATSSINQERGICKGADVQTGQRRSL